MEQSVWFWLFSIDFVNIILILGNKRDCPQRSQLAYQDFVQSMLFQKENCHHYAHLIPSLLEASKMITVTLVLSAVLQVMCPAYKEVM